MAATIKDIAKKTGLGLATISSYLNGGSVREKNRIKIEEAIAELHYEVNEVARGLKTKKTKMIGIIIPELNNVFCAEIITEVEDQLRSKGYATLICDCRTDEKREQEAVEFMKKRRVDGVIVMPSGKTGQHFSTLKQAGIPIVMIDRKLKDLDCDCVLVDNRTGTKEAIESLIQLGHKNIGIICGPEEVYTAEERLHGYYEAMEQHQLPIRTNLIYRGDYTIRSGAKGAQKLMEDNQDMTALLVSNYEMTLGTMIEMNELGVKIPEELSVIGFDDIEFARACVPKLSIVTQPKKEIADCVAKRMLEILDGQMEEGTHIVEKLSTGFVEGKSVRGIEQ